MYKDKGKQREAVREAVRKHRGITPVSQGITYPPLIHSLSIPEDRRKLRQVCDALKAHNLLPHLMVGTSGITFKRVSELLECLE